MKFLRLLLKIAHSNYTLLLLGASVTFAFAPFNHIIWLILPIFILMFRLHNSSNLRQICIVGYLFGFGFFSAHLYWIICSMYKTMHTGLIVAVFAPCILYIYLATFIVIGCVLYHKLKTSYMWFNCLCLFPSIWVLMEWLRLSLIHDLAFTWCSIGYIGVNYTSLSWIFGFLGEYAVSWALLSMVGCVYYIYAEFTNSIKAKIMSYMNTMLNMVGSISGKSIGFNLGSNNRGRFKTALLVSVAYMWCYLLLGNFLMVKSYTQPYGKPFRVALVQGNISFDQKWVDTDRVLDHYVDMVNNIVDVDFIFMPENALGVFLHQIPLKYLYELKARANDLHAVLITGAPIIIDNKGSYVNAAVALNDPKMPYYAKHHLVPYGEYIPQSALINWLYHLLELPMTGFTPGAKNQPPLLEKNQRLAINICYENGFGNELIKSAMHSSVMVNLSDLIWYGNTIMLDQDLEISKARALENGRYFIQDTNDGPTVVINPHGIVVAKLDRFVSGVLYANIWGMQGVTQYEKWGNLPIVLLCVIIILLSLFNKLVIGKNELAS